MRTLIAGWTVIGAMSGPARVVPMHTGGPESLASDRGVAHARGPTPCGCGRGTFLPSARSPVHRRGSATALCGPCGGGAASVTAARAPRFRERSTRNPSGRRCCVLPPHRKERAQGVEGPLSVNRFSCGRWVAPECVPRPLPDPADPLAFGSRSCPAGGGFSSCREGRQALALQGVPGRSRFEVRFPGRWWVRQRPRFV